MRLSLKQLQGLQPPKSQLSKPVQALRYAAKALLIIYYGGRLLPAEAKTFADLCCLAIPVKYRFSALEMAKIKSGVNQALQEQLVNKHCHECGIGYKVFPEQIVCPRCERESLL